MAAAKTAARKTAKAKNAAAANDLTEFSDVLLDNVNHEDLPGLIGLHQLPRRQRADLLAQVQPLMDAMTLAEAQVKAGSQDYAALASMIADVEDVLGTVAVDPTAYKIWAGAASDEHLLGLLGRYVGSLGEASGSSR